MERQKVRFGIMRKQREVLVEEVDDTIIKLDGVHLSGTKTDEGFSFENPRDVEMVLIKRKRQRVGSKFKEC